MLGGFFGDLGFLFDRILKWKLQKMMCSTSVGRSGLLQVGRWSLDRDHHTIGCKSIILLMEEILHQLRLVVYPIIYTVLYISGGAGFLPSTVVSHKNSQKDSTAQNLASLKKGYFIKLPRQQRNVSDS